MIIVSRNKAKGLKQCKYHVYQPIKIFWEVKVTPRAAPLSLRSRIARCTQNFEVRAILFHCHAQGLWLFRLRKQEVGSWIKETFSNLPKPQARRKRMKPTAASYCCRK